MDQLLPLKHADATAPISAGFIHQRGHQKTVRLQQIPFRIRSPLLHPFISGKGILHFLNLSRWTKHQLAFDHRTNLLQGQRILLNLKGSLNRANSISAPQHCIPSFSPRAQPLAEG